jgi:hypothetical protein
MEELLWTYLHHQMVLALLLLLVLLLPVQAPLVLLLLVLLLVELAHQEVLHNLRLGQLCL